MPRLLHVTTVEATLRAFLLPYALHFRRLGWRVDALTGESPVPHAEVRAAFDAVHTVAWGRNPVRALTRLPACCRQIRALVRQNRYDIVHVHTPIASFITRLALRRMRADRPVRVVYTAHGFHFHRYGKTLRNWTFLCLEKLAGQWTDALIVVNREDSDAARQHQIVAEAKLHRMPEVGIDLERWDRNQVGNETATNLHRTLEIGENGSVLLCVGELIPRKRHGDLLRGFAAYLAHVADARAATDVVLILAGDGPLRHSLGALARRLGIAAQVRFVGFQDELRPLYELADATLLVSLQEGLPLSIMEALAMETPVIATDVRGNHELVDDSCGFLVPPRDPMALAAALHRMLGMKPEERRELGRRGREKMADYTLARCLKLTEDLYADLRA